jgi:hypothetical protein
LKDSSGGIGSAAHLAGGGDRVKWGSAMPEPRVRIGIDHFILSSACALIY